MACTEHPVIRGDVLRASRKRSGRTSQEGFLKEARKRSGRTSQEGFLKEA